MARVWKKGDVIPLDYINELERKYESLQMKVGKTAAPAVPKKAVGEKDGK